MAANDELMGFAQRFKAIEANQDTSNGLIKVGSYTRDV